MQERSSEAWFESMSGATKSASQSNCYVDGYERPVADSNLYSPIIYDAHTAIPEGANRWFESMSLA